MEAGVMAQNTTRPVVRYHGGKWRLAPWIISHFPKHRVYVEPFAGGGSVLMRKPRCYAEVYNDLDGEIVNVFRVLRDPVQAKHLADDIRLTAFARDEFELSYAPSDDPVEQARRTIVRAFMGFGSAAASGQQRTGFRANSNRSGTTPARDWVNYPDVIPAFVERLRGVVIENKDAVEVMRQHDGERVLHYVDPPYVGETRYEGSQGRSYRHELDADDHIALLGALKSLSGYVVLSGYPCEMYDDALAGWTRIERDALADGARKRTEVLWINRAEAAQGKLFV